jgi:glycosyltransferase involved in cell wall biosynthesis
VIAVRRSAEASRSIASSPRRRVLYISYDGILEPLGESQVVAYLERLTDAAAITLLSFEKRADLAETSRVTAMAARLQRAGITWIRRPYHKRPPVASTALDIAVGCVAARRWARRDGSGSIVHARGYVPAMIALHVKRYAGARFVFDMRGFWVDEKVEAGQWPPNGMLYRIGKRYERRFLAAADAVVSLTAAGVRELPRLGRVREGAPVVVIPTCADLDRFAPGPPCDRLRGALGLDGALVAGYAGTLSNWYLRDETLLYFAFLARRFDRMKALFVTREDHGRLRTDAARAGLPADRLVVTRASFDEMPALMRLMHVGVFFIRVCFSKRASAATKLAEFLGCGIPVVINDGIGDSGEIVRAGRAGVVLDDTTPDRFEASAANLERLLADPLTATRCRETAVRHFDLAAGAASYRNLYERLAG